MSKFVEGQSGNPSGRPRGIKDRRVLFAKMLNEHKQQLFDKALERALSGDAQMLRFFLERLIPKPRSEAVNVDFSKVDVTKTGGLLILGAEILEAATNQIITPEQGKVLADIVESQRKNIEASELAIRVTEIEGILKSRKTSAKLCKQ